jgi:hypothetical protein
MSALRQQTTLHEIAQTTGITVASLGRQAMPVSELDSREIEAIKRVWYYGLEHIRKISPTIYADIARQDKLVFEFAKVAKAILSVVKKNYQFPSVPGSLGVAWLFPQAIGYKVDNVVGATGYSANSWDIPITAGSKAYILGSDTAWYKTSAVTEKRHCILILENGLIEYGTTPSVEQFRLVSEAKQDFGIYTVEPLVDVPLEYGKATYQYPTPNGALFVDYQTGVRWYFIPKRTGTMTLKLLGLVFYEHDFASDVKWIA